MSGAPPGRLATLAVAVWMLTPVSPAAAQSWRAQVGYDALVAELGTAPAQQYEGLSFIPPADSSWSYRKGTSEASSPVEDWRGIAFVEDGSWLSGQTSIGYGDGDDNTELTDMKGMNGYTTVYLRHGFTIAAGAIPSRLILRVYVDDGAVVWINGTEVARLHVGSGFQPFDATANSHEAEWETLILNNPAAYLVEGSNLIAIHAMNDSFNSMDFSIDAELLDPGVRVTHTEALNGTKYLPESWSGGGTPNEGDSYPGTGGANGKTFFVRSVDPALTYAQSSHARNVGVNYFYGSGTRTLAPTLKEVDCYHAGDWLEGDFLQFQSSSTEPLRETNLLQNHSWIADPDEFTSAAQLNVALRRIDYAIERDGFLSVVGLNNGAAEVVPALLGSAYNALSVGVTDGGHSSGLTLPSYDGGGRLKPEIVAPATATSFSTGMVSSGAAMLFAAANEQQRSGALDSKVMKAILMAGATKDEFPAWTRSSTQPIDSHYGAGEMNVQKSYRILVAGEQDTATPSVHDGWAHGTLAAASSSIYTIDICRPADQLSAVLTWNRTVEGASWHPDGGSFSATLANMSLQLHRIVDGVPVLWDSSDSAIDNIEHVFLRELPIGTYTLTVSTDVAADYALAWRADPGELSTFALAKGSTDDEMVFTFTGLAPGKNYSMEVSNDLLSWDPYISFTAPGETHTHTDPTGRADLSTYYTLQWNPVN